MGDVQRHEFVLAYFPNPVGYDEWCTVEVTDADGVVTIQRRFGGRVTSEYIRPGSGSGSREDPTKAKTSMFEDNGSRVSCPESGGYALYPGVGPARRRSICAPAIHCDDDPGALVVPNKIPLFAVQEGEERQHDVTTTPSTTTASPFALGAILAGTAESGPARFSRQPTTRSTRRPANRAASL